MLASMSAEQFDEWAAFHELEPRGEFRDDFRMAALAADVLGIFTKKGAKRINPAEIMIFSPLAKKRKNVPKQQSVKEQARILDEYIEAHRRKNERSGTTNSPTSR